MLIHIWLVFILCCQATWSVWMEDTSRLCDKQKKVLFLLHFDSQLSENSDFQSLVDFIQAMIDRFQRTPNITTQVAVVTFIPGYKKDIRFHKSKTLEAVKEEVREMGTQMKTDSNKNNTALSDAIFYAADFMCGNSSFTQIIIVLTNTKATKTDPELRLAVDASRGKNHEIIAVGIGRLDLYSGLFDIATDYSTRYVYSVPSFNNLSKIIEGLSASMCLYRTTVYENLGSMRQASVTQPDCRGKSIHPEILLAGSQAWRTNNLTEVIHFIEYIITAMDVKPNVTQLHITAPAQDEATLLLLNQSIASLNDVSEVLSKIQIVDPKTSESLSKMKDSVFTKAGSGAEEQNTTQIVIVINVGPFQPQDVKDIKVAAQRLKHDGIRIVAIGVNGTTPEDLENIASTPFNRTEPLHFEVDNYTALVDIEDTVVQRVCREMWVVETKQLHAKDVPKSDMPILYAM